MKYPHALILFLIILALAGCTSTKMYRSDRIKFESLEKWPVYYQETQQQLRTIQSDARISIESSQLATNITISLVYASPDTLFLQAEGPFGLDLGKIFIGKWRFIVFNQFNNQFFTGALDDAYFNTFLNTDFSFGELKFGLIGSAPSPNEAILVNPAEGIFEKTAGEQRYRYTVDKNSGNLKTFEILDNNTVIFLQEFRTYRDIDGLIFPRLIRIILPQKKEMVAIYHKNIKINQQLDKERYAIEIGPKTKQIIIGYDR